MLYIQKGIIWKGTTVKRAVASATHRPPFQLAAFFCFLSCLFAKGKEKKPQAIQAALTIKITLLTVERVLKTFLVERKNLRRQRANEKAGKKEKIDANYH